MHVYAACYIYCMYVECMCIQCICMLYACICMQCVCMLHASVYNVYVCCMDVYACCINMYVCCIHVYAVCVYVYWQCCFAIYKRAVMKSITVLPTPDPHTLYILHLIPVLCMFPFQNPALCTLYYFWLLHFVRGFTFKPLQLHNFDTHHSLQHATIRPTYHFTLYSAPSLRNFDFTAVPYHVRNIFACLWTTVAADCTLPWTPAYPYLVLSQILSCGPVHCLASQLSRQFQGSHSTVVCSSTSTPSVALGKCRNARIVSR